MCAQGLISEFGIKHPRRQAENQPGGTQLQIRLHRFRVPLAAVMQRGGGEQPDEERVRNRRRQSRQHRLPDGAAHRDDERRHHRFGMARLQPVPRAGQDGGGQEEPEIGGTRLNRVQKIRREVMLNLPPVLFDVFFRRRRGAQPPARRNRRRIGTGAPSGVHPMASQPESVNLAA